MDISSPLLLVAAKTLLVVKGLSVRLVKASLRPASIQGMVLSSVTGEASNVGYVQHLRASAHRPLVRLTCGQTSFTHRSSKRPPVPHAAVRHEAQLLNSRALMAYSLRKRRMQGKSLTRSFSWHHRVVSVHSSCQHIHACTWFTALVMQMPAAKSYRSRC